MESRCGMMAGNTAHLEHNKNQYAVYVINNKDQKRLNADNKV